MNRTSTKSTLSADDIKWPEFRLIPTFTRTMTTEKYEREKRRFDEFMDSEWRRMDLGLPTNVVVEVEGPT